MKARKRDRTLGNKWDITALVAEAEAREKDLLKRRVTEGRLP